jgi:hypothetical protein
MYAIRDVHHNTGDNPLEQVLQHAHAAVRVHGVHDIRRDILYPLSILISQLTLLCLLLTFGVLFPPLAAAILYNLALFEKLKIGRFILLALEKNSLKYLDIIRVESQGVGSVLKLREALWMIGAFTLLLYTCSFSTQGVLVVVPIFLLVLYIVCSAYTYQAELPQRWRQQDPSAATEQHLLAYAGTRHVCDGDQGEKC